MSLSAIHSRRKCSMGTFLNWSKGKVMIKCRIYGTSQYRQNSKECMWRQRGHFHMVFNVYDRKVTRKKEEHMSPCIDFPLKAR